MKLDLLLVAAQNVRGIPRHYAAASLKHVIDHLPNFRCGAKYSAALRRGLIEAWCTIRTSRAVSRYSAALRRGLIEALQPPRPRRLDRLYSAALRRGLIEAAPSPSLTPDAKRIPRHYAAASLKLKNHQSPRALLAAYSAALRRGLIEALDCVVTGTAAYTAYSAALRRGLIEAMRPARRAGSPTRVFRGITPRPH